MKKTSLLIALSIACLGAFGQIQKVAKPTISFKPLKLDSVAVFTFNRENLSRDADKLKPGASAQTQPVMMKVHTASLPLQDLKIKASLTGGSLEWDDNIHISATRPKSVGPWGIIFQGNEDDCALTLSAILPPNKDYLVRVKVNSSCERIFEINSGALNSPAYRISGDGEIVFLVQPRGGFIGSNPQFKISAKAVVSSKDASHSWKYEGLTIEEL